MLFLDRDPTEQKSCFKCLVILIIYLLWKQHSAVPTTCIVVLITSQSRNSWDGGPKDSYIK